MTLMRAAQLREPGKGPGALRIEQVPRPVPGAGEVLIRVHSVGANHLDLGAMTGLLPGGQVRAPLRVGIDPAGEIIGVGAGVAVERVGSRVVVKPNIPCGQCRWCAGHAEAECPAQRVIGVHVPGGAAELVVVPERNAVPVPDGMPYPSATAAVHSVPVALHMVRRAGAVRKGEPVLITGADGAVGSCLTQLVAAMGAVPVPVVHGWPGASFHTYDELPDVLAERAPRGVPIAFDATGAAPAITAAWDALGWDGTLVVCSAAPGAELVVDVRRLYLRRQRLIGSASADFADVADGLAMVASGAVSVPVGPEFRLDDVVDAYAAVADPDRRGKVVVHVLD